VLKDKAKTHASYDVGKTIGQLRADMESGVTTSREVTEAYLDRIDVYDRGQFGFNAFEIIAADAMEQAKAADHERSRGATGPLLGIPIAVKNLYDTLDMPTTNGSMTFAGFRPAHDAFQVARLREAGAVIIGKTALEEYATWQLLNDAWGTSGTCSTRRIPRSRPAAAPPVHSRRTWPPARWDRRQATPCTVRRAARAL
jgi:amidase